jgi:hypothetical protein
VNAHGTSTPLGDVAETVAIKRALGDHAKNIVVNSTKSMTGHLLGGAGGLESVFTVLSIYNQVSPPTINIFNQDPECDLDYCANTARDLKIEYALKNNRKKVTCFSKDNIMKFTDGIFHKVFDEVRQEYSTLESDHYIVDIGSAKLASKPEIFDVIVTSNLYGDIISDIAAQVAGSVGLGGSANIGENFAMFEAIHGSAPRRAGQNMANPSGLIQGAILMLNHIGENTVAEKIQNAWLKTIEDGVHTYDVFKEGISTQKVGTKEFANAVIANLGNKPVTLNAVNYSNGAALNLPKYVSKLDLKKQYHKFAKIKVHTIKKFKSCIFFFV